MKVNFKSLMLLLCHLAVGLFLVLSGPGVISTFAHEEEEPPGGDASGSTWTPETCTDDSQCGDLGPLIPMTYNAVGAGMVWSSDNWEVPMIQYKGRHSEFKPTDMLDEKCLEDMILNSKSPVTGFPYSAWPIPRSEWAPQFPLGTSNPPSGAVTQDYATWTNPATAYNIFFDAQRVTRLDPVGISHQAKSFNPCFRSSFKHLVYGGYNRHQGQSLFVANRIRAYDDKENSQLWDLRNPVAFANRGIFDNALIDEEDALLNLDSFTDAGASRGLHYNIYSLGYATLADGRVVNEGGHNMQSNNGFRKLNIYDPETNSWAPRPVPCQVAHWRADRYGVALGYQSVADAAAGGSGVFDPDGTSRRGEALGNAPSGAPTWSDCNQRIRDQVDPPHSSDMRYPRWYPSAITMADGRVLVYGGDDLDETIGPNPTIANVNRNAVFSASTVFLPVSEIYDPKTDTTVALENARKIWPLYPMATVVETGPKDADWKVCVLGGEPAPASEATVPRSDAIDEAAEWRNYCTDSSQPLLTYVYPPINAYPPGNGATQCNATRDPRAVKRRTPGHSPTPAASLDCLDVLAAEKDPNVNVPAENYWTHIATAQNSYDYCCGTADIVKIGPKGKTLSHKWIVASGSTAGDGPAQNTIEVIDFAEANPTLRVMNSHLVIPVSTGLQGTALPDGNVIWNMGAGTGPATGPYDERYNTRYQLFDPWNDTIKVLAKTTIAGPTFHCTVLLLPDATLITMACDRVNLVSQGDREFSPGDQDLGVSVAQIFYPPYLFADAAGTLKTRPVINHGPDQIEYRETMTLQVDDASKIQTVSMFRTGFVTHTLNTDNRLVILNFKVGPDNTLIVDAPFRPAQAVPGDYMVYVVNQDGTPSVAKHVRLKL